MTRISPPCGTGSPKIAILRLYRAIFCGSNSPKTRKNQRRPFCRFYGQETGFSTVRTSANPLLVSGSSLVTSSRMVPPISAASLSEWPGTLRLRRRVRLAAISSAKELFDRAAPTCPRRNLKALFGRRAARRIHPK